MKVWDNAQHYTNNGNTRYIFANNRSTLYILEMFTAGGFGATNLVNPGLFPGQTVTDPFNPYPNALNSFQKFPVFVINKSKGGDHFKWLIPLLLILGAPLLCGLLLIPIALQSVFFFMTIARNLGICRFTKLSIIKDWLVCIWLGFLLPLIPAITGLTGLTGNGGNPIIPTTG